jgi:hypothetical protein
MTIERESGKVRVVLDPREVTLLRHALERALFIDTPVADQEAIMTFSNRLLDALAPRP